MTLNRKNIKISLIGIGLILGVIFVSGCVNSDNSIFKNEFVEFNIPEGCAIEDDSSGEFLNLNILKDGKKIGTLRTNPRYYLDSEAVKKEFKEKDAYEKIQNGTDGYINLAIILGESGYVDAEGEESYKIYYLNFNIKNKKEYDYILDSLEILK
jgi:hypothetical protein